MSDTPEKNIIVDRGVPPGRSENPYGTGGGGGSGGGGWSFGFGGAGGGFTGGFGGSSGKRAKKRAKARRAAQQRAWAEAEAARQQAEHERAIAAHQQLLASLAEDQALRKAQLEQLYTERAANLAEGLEAEIEAAKKRFGPPGEERLQLYLISKQKAELQGLIDAKQQALSGHAEQALSFDGSNLLGTATEGYSQTLAQRSGLDGQAARALHERWQQAYAAAHEARLLGEAIQRLEEKSQALTERYRVVEQQLRETDALRQKEQQYAQQRQAQITHRMRVDEALRRELIEAAHTHAVPPTPTASAAVLGAGGTLVFGSAGDALVNAARSQIKAFLGVLAKPGGPTVAVALLALYPTPVGNGELTLAQRRRLMRAAALPAASLGAPTAPALHAHADAGTAAPLDYRLRPVLAEQGAELHLLAPSSGEPAPVPVVNAAFDPSSATYTAKVPGVPGRQLAFSPGTPGLQAEVAPTAPELLTTAALAEPVPEGSDPRIEDCIVCFPADSGLAPTYVTFLPAPVGYGVAIGQGQPAGANWWPSAAEDGASIPAQVAERFSQREFLSAAALESAFWRAVAEDPLLSQPVDEVNRKRMALGYAPVAPKATWAGARRAFELRFNAVAAGVPSPDDLDQASVVVPSSSHGARRTQPAYLPWPVAGGSRTWTPLIPPGSGLLGPTELPGAPEQPTVIPGSEAETGGIQTPPLPIPETGDVDTRIPGFGEGDDELPSPDVVFAGPMVEPLEVTTYADCRRRSHKDGLDCDHIASKGALKEYMAQHMPRLSPREVDEYLINAPSIAIPAEVHSKFSETYKGRNSKVKRLTDAADLRRAVESNVDAIKVGLLEAGFAEIDIENARAQLHTLNQQQGWY